LSQAETSIIDSLEKHVEKLPSENSSEDSDNEKKSKKTKAKKKGSDSDDEDLKEEEEEEYDDYDQKEKKQQDDDSEGSQDTESGEAEEEPEDLMNLFAGMPSQQQAFFNLAPTFGPGANIFSPPPINQQNYNDKASYVKKISAVNDTLLTPYNPSMMPANNYGTQPLSNPFGVNPNPPSQPLSNPFGATSNPFGPAVSTPATSNPFGPSPFSVPQTTPSLNPNITGSSSGYGVPMNKPLLNPLPSITGSNPGYSSTGANSGFSSAGVNHGFSSTGVNPGFSSTGANPGFSSTGANPFSNGMGNNTFPSSSFNPPPSSGMSGGNPFGPSFSSTPSITTSGLGGTPQPNYGQISNNGISTSQPSFGVTISGTGFNNPQNPFGGNTPIVRNPTTNPFL